MSAADTPVTAQDSPFTLIELISQKRSQLPYAVFTKELENRVQKRMRLLCQEIRATPGWMETLKLPNERSELFANVIAQCEFRQEAEVIFEKLDYLASIHPGTDIEISTVDYVWTSDTLIDKSIQDDLKSLTALLEVDSDFLIHNFGSNKHVQKLIDPYLYPFVVGCSRVVSKPIISPILALSAHTSTHLPADVEELKVFLNRNFKRSGKQDYKTDSNLCTTGNSQMLPTEFFIDLNGGVTIGPYINNLHPEKFSDFYPTISTIFSKLVPLFEQTLADMAYSCQEFTFNYDLFLKRHQEAYCSCRSGYTVFENQTYFRQLIESNHDIITFKHPDRPKLHNTLLGQRLQASIEIKSITLSPEFSVYDGDKWYISGLYDENIAATGIYYYDCENIACAGLAFREKISTESFDFYLKGDNGDKFNVLFDPFDYIED